MNTRIAIRKLKEQLQVRHGLLVGQLKLDHLLLGFEETALESCGKIGRASRQNICMAGDVDRAQCRLLLLLLLLLLLREALARALGQRLSVIIAGLVVGSIAWLVRGIDDRTAHYQIAMDSIQELVPQISDEPGGGRLSRGGRRRRECAEAGKHGRGRSEW